MPAHPEKDDPVHFVTNCDESHIEQADHFLYSFLNGDCCSIRQEAVFILLWVSGYPPLQVSYFENAGMASSLILPTCHEREPLKLFKTG